MASSGLKELTLKLEEVTDLRQEVGHGAYGRVYAIRHRGTVYAAKEIHSILLQFGNETERQIMIESFLRECRQCSDLRHPNIVQFIGVYYPKKVPVMVMEMMADSLAKFVEKHKNIPVRTKYSIAHDVSLGLWFLHYHDPPIVHCDLSSNNVLLTAHCDAKIGDLGVAKTIKAGSKTTLARAPGNVCFMPPESLTDNPDYGPPMDVFSFAGVVLHTFNQEWPYPLDQHSKTTLSEVKRRQHHLDKLKEEAGALMLLLKVCLNNDPAARPTIKIVSEKIQEEMDAYNKKFPQDPIALLQQSEQPMLGYEQEQKLIAVEPSAGSEVLEKMQTQKMEFGPQKSIEQVLIKPIIK